MPSLMQFPIGIMIERTLDWEQLGLTSQEIFHDLQCDDAMSQEASEILDEVSGFLQSRFAFVTTGIDTLQRFSPGRIILSQLRNSEALCYFVATAGCEFEEYQHKLMLQGDMVKVYLANEIGSMIAERTADKMEELLQAQLTPKGLNRTNRFSPGYCGWHVSEQPLLFELFDQNHKKTDDTPQPLPEPCGIHLTDSCLMLPIKSVSGIIGIGHNVKKLDYTCGICKLDSCYKRKKKNQAV